MTTLEKSLLPASSMWETQRTSGWKTSSVSIIGQDGRNFLLVKPHGGWKCGWSFRVVTGCSEDGLAVLEITKSGCGTTVSIKDLKTEEGVVMKSPSYLRRIRVFTWGGQEYMWKRSSKMFAKRVTYTLTPVDNPDNALAENTWGGSCLRKSTGCITIFDAGSHFPAHLVIAMGLSMEQLWHDSRTDGSVPGGGVGGFF